MFFAVDEQQVRRAKGPHELSMINLLLFNPAIAIALLAGSMARPDSAMAVYKWYGVAVPLLFSIALILFTVVRAARAERSEPWFVAAHWRLSAGRCRLLPAAYLVSAAVVGLAFVGDGGHADLERRIADLPPVLQQMERDKLASQHLGRAIWARIGVMPLLLTVMVLLVLESGALYQAGRGEVPDRLVERFPPPSDLRRSDAPMVDAVVDGPKASPDD